MSVNGVVVECQASGKITAKICIWRQIPDINQAGFMNNPSK
jgi:hypothetical protein